MRLSILCLVGLVIASAGDAAADSPAQIPVDLGAYIQPGFTWAENSDFDDNDGDGFEFANARILAAAGRALQPGLAASLTLNFDVNQGNFAAKDVYGSLVWLDGLVAVDAGQMKTSFGLALQQSEALLELPVSPRIRVLSFGRDLGLRLRGQLEPGGVHIGWWAMVANGEGGFRQRRNIDNKMIYLGRVEVAPLGPVGPSEPDLERGPLRFAVAADGAYTPSLGNGLGIGDVGADEFRIGADARLTWRGVSFRGEVIMARRGDNDVSDGFGRYGVHLQAGYVLPLSIQGVQIEPVVRFEQLDLNDSSDGLMGSEYIIDETAVRRYEAGLDAYIVGHDAKLQLAYQRNDLLEGPVVDTDGGPLIGDRVLLFMQLAWGID